MQFSFEVDLTSSKLTISIQLLGLNHIVMFSASDLNHVKIKIRNFPDFTLHLITLE